jgi:hypothetical protein
MLFCRAGGFGEVGPDAGLSTGVTCEGSRRSMTVRTRLCVGIDVGKTAHYACIVDAEGDYSVLMPPITVAGLCTPHEVRTAKIDCATAYLVDNEAWPASDRVTGNVRRPKRDNRRTRRVLCVATLSSIGADGLSWQFYDGKRAPRLIHTQALLALARRCSAPEGFRTSAPHRKGTC